MHDDFFEKRFHSRRYLFQQTCKRGVCGDWNQNIIFVKPRLHFDVLLSSKTKIKLAQWKEMLSAIPENSHLLVMGSDHRISWHHSL